jgi:hypothetical protein
MPFQNEHAARQTEPSEYKEFRRYTPKGFPMGLSTILGIKADGSSEIQSIRADKAKFSPSEFEKWLKEHDFKATIEEAIDKGFFAKWIPIDTLEKGAVPGDDPNGNDSLGGEGKIAGIVSTDDMDFEGERISQDGLDWDYFLKHGWFNHEHRPGPEAVLGNPTKIERIDDNRTRVEGVLYLDKPLARECYETALAIKKAGANRSLGFSIEGRVLLRDPSDKKKVLKAQVLHVAITNAPVNPNTNLEVIARSMGANVGYQEPAIADADASQSALVEQSLEQKLSNASYGQQKKDKKMISKQQIKELVKKQFSSYSNEELDKMVSLLMRAAKTKESKK